MSMAQRLRARFRVPADLLFHFRRSRLPTFPEASGIALVDGVEEDGTTQSLFRSRAG